jgi:hypothetical protein
LVFFADRNLGRYEFPELMRAGGIDVRAHDDHFAQNAPDDVWIPQVAERGWVILSPDQHIQRNAAELAAVMLSGAALLCLIGGHEKTADLAANFLNTRAKIEQFVTATTTPFIAKVYRPSPVSDIAREFREASSSRSTTPPGWRAGSPSASDRNLPHRNGDPTSSPTMPAARARAKSSRIARSPSSPTSRVKRLT